MSKKANPTLVGVFVLVAVALTVATIITLGNFKFKDNRIRCLAYFTGSLYGLDIGAPVTFRGVVIGRVSQIQIKFDQQQNNYIIPVSIDIEQSPHQERNGGNPPSPAQVRQKIEELIAQGLRAQLKMSSLLTSKLYIDLAIHPDSELRLYGKNPGLIEIPTLPSGLEQITQRLESLPLSDIINKAASALDGINRIINSAETRSSLQALDSTLSRLDTLMASADSELPALAAELKKGLTNVSGLAATATGLLRTADRELPPMSRDLQRLLANLNTTAVTLTRTLGNIEQLSAKDSLFSYQVAGALDELKKAATSIRQLSEYLQQNPNALIFGQGKDRP